MKDIYSEKLKKQLFENISQVEGLLENKDKQLLKKMQKYSEKYEISMDDIVREINSNNKFAINYFAKDPKNQNFYEKTAADYISAIAGVTDFKNLGNAALYLVRGAVVAKKDNQIYPNAKTIDFSFKYQDKCIYVSHKYTYEDGGAQHGQYVDLKAFIKEARDGSQQGNFFIAIADGPYYQRKDASANKIRIENLKSMCTPSVKVCIIEELEEVLKQL